MTSANKGRDPAKESTIMAKKKPKVGENISEPLSAAEIAAREAEAERDREAQQLPAPKEPKPPESEESKPKLFRRKNNEAEAQRIANERASLEAERERIFAAGSLAAVHAELAIKNGCTGEASNLKMIAEAARQLKARRADYLDKRGKK